MNKDEPDSLTRRFAIREFLQGRNLIRLVNGVPNVRATLDALWDSGWTQEFTQQFGSAKYVIAEFFGQKVKGMNIDDTEQTADEETPEVEAAPKRKPKKAKKPAKAKKPRKPAVKAAVKRERKPRPPVDDEKVAARNAKAAEAARKWAEKEVAKAKKEERRVTRKELALALLDRKEGASRAELEGAFSAIDPLVSKHTINVALYRYPKDVGKNIVRLENGNFALQ